MASKKIGTTGGAGQSSSSKFLDPNYGLSRGMVKSKSAECRFELVVQETCQLHDDPASINTEVQRGLYVAPTYSIHSGLDKLSAVAGVVTTPESYPHKVAIRRPGFLTP